MHGYHVLKGECIHCRYAPLALPLGQVSQRLKAAKHLIVHTLTSMHTHIFVMLCTHRHARYYLVVMAQ